ncbi:MAG TPA: histidine kinase [Kofleriaceae bacterium]|nr:histidine kinase [Kofleriaceae bacterium]
MTLRPHTSFALAGLAAWLLVSLPTWIGAQASPRFPVWAAAWAVCGAAMLAVSRRPRLDAVAAAALALQGAAVATMVGLLCNGFEGLLLVFAAAQLGRLAGLRLGAGWLVAHTLVVGAAIAAHWSPQSAAMLMAPYLGCQLFAFLAARLHGALAERGRAEERLRIARELHDALGHHLTAMSLNLELAAHQTSGEARDNVRAAQSLARLLLGDVRELAYAMKQGRATDLADGLARLAETVPVPAIHVELPSGLRIADPRSAHALLRCAQEFVTNSIRHAGARNVWIALRAGGAELELTARDDGAGARELRPGGGLSGLRERVEELGGSLVLDAGGAGFALRATVPA